MFLELVWDDVCFAAWRVILLEVAIRRWVHCGHKGMHMVSNNTQSSHFIRSHWTETGAVPMSLSMYSQTPPAQLPQLMGGRLLHGKQLKNAIPEPQVTPTPQIHLQPFDYDGEVYIGNPGEDQTNVVEEEGEEEEEEGGQDKRENQVASEDQSPRGDVFSPESVSGPGTEVKEIPVAPGHEEFIMDCNFDQGACDWVQDKEDDFDWSVAYHDIAGSEYYMAASGLLGEVKDLGRLKLLLSDRAQRAGFCLTFNYRLVGEQVWALRILLNNSGHPLWEQSQGHGADWHTEFITVAWEQEALKMIIFEAERGKGVGGEIGLDDVVLTSGPCQEDEPVIF